MLMTNSLVCFVLDRLHKLIWFLSFFIYIFSFGQWNEKIIFVFIFVEASHTKSEKNDAENMEGIQAKKAADSHEIIYSVYILDFNTSRWNPIRSYLITYSPFGAVLSECIVIFFCTLVIAIVKLSCEFSAGWTMDWVGKKRHTHTWTIEVLKRNEKCKRHNKQLMAIKGKYMVHGCGCKMF